MKNMGAHVFKNRIVGNFYFSISCAIVSAFVYHIWVTSGVSQLPITSAMWGPLEDVINVM